MASGLAIASSRAIASSPFTDRDGTVSLITRSASGDGSVWDVAPTAWEAAACSIAGRPLTQDEWDRYINVAPSTLADRQPLPYAPACR